MVAQTLSSLGACKFMKPLIGAILSTNLSIRKAQHLYFLPPTQVCPKVLRAYVGLPVAWGHGGMACLGRISHNQRWMRKQAWCLFAFYNLSQNRSWHDLQLNMGLVGWWKESITFNHSCMLLASPHNLRSCFTRTRRDYQLVWTQAKIHL